MNPRLRCFRPPLDHLSYQPRLPWGHEKTRCRWRHRVKSPAGSGPSVTRAAAARAGTSPVVRRSCLRICTGSRISSAGKSWFPRFLGARASKRCLNGVADWLDGHLAEGFAPFSFQPHLRCARPARYSIAREVPETTPHEAREDTSNSQLSPVATDVTGPASRSAARRGRACA